MARNALTMALRRSRTAWSAAGILIDIEFLFGQPPVRICAFIMKNQAGLDHFGAAGRARHHDVGGGTGHMMETQMRIWWLVHHAGPVPQTLSFHPRERRADNEKTDIRCAGFDCLVGG